MVIYVNSSSSLIAFLLLFISPLVENMYLNTTEKLNIFKLPLKIDPDDALETYGQFMKNIMNLKKNPCEDFYEYACGNWNKAEDVPINLRNETFLNILQTYITEFVTQFLSESVEKNTDQNSAEFKVKMFYQNCVSRGQLYEAYRKLILLPEFKNESIKDWIDINFLSSTEMYAILPLKTTYNSETRKTELLISPPSRVLSDPNIVNVHNLTTNLQINDKKEQDLFVKEFLSMIRFEAHLISHVKARASNDIERLTLKDFLLRHSKDKLNWSRYFNAAFNGTQKENWIVQNKLQETGKLINFLQRTDSKTLQNYIKWRTLVKFYYIWKPIRNITYQEHCRIQTEQYFSYALVPYLVSSIYDMEKRADILNISGNIKSIFHNFIEKSDWLDEETRSQVRTKLNVVDVKAGYIDILSNADHMNEVYNDVNITKNWFDDVLALEIKRAQLKRLSVGKVLIPPPMFIASANAYYVNFLNEIFVAIGLSQFPLYHSNYPESLKYGGIGHIVGHELAHAFDNTGYQFNYDGRTGRKWWTEASLRRFRERFRCFESQYNRFIFQGEATNGSFTLSDNIADNVGIRVAYHAYLQTSGQRDFNHSPLPNVKLNNRQLFFIRFAQTWCTGQDEQSTLNHIKSDVHAFGKFRVIGTLRNMQEFSESFQCKLGTSMNPLRKCILW